MPGVERTWSLMDLFGMVMASLVVVVPMVMVVVPVVMVVVPFRW